MKNDFHKLEIKTPQSLLDKGMYACSSCGGLNALEDEKCKKCNAEKFVIR